MSSTRLITEQFGQGIDVSGSRIDKAIQDLFDVMNSVDPSLTMRRWVQTTLVAGHQPLRLPAIIGVGWNPAILPWMGQDNATQKSALDPPADTYNTFRTKSSFIEGASDLLTWCVSINLTRPTILSSVTIWMVTDPVYANTMVYGAPEVENPEGGTYPNGDPLRDLTVLVTIDSALDTENRVQNAVESIQHRFPVDRAKITFNAPDPAWDTMIPPHPEGCPTGICVEIPVICLLPENSRMRLEVVIPKYPDATSSGWGEYPWQPQVMSVNVGLLESTLEG